MKDLTQEEWKTQLAADNNAVIIDVRTNEEREEDGFMPNALHMDIYYPQQFMKALETLDKTKNFYIYCRSGGRSVQACTIFKQSGLNNTFNLLGGFSCWQGKIERKTLTE